MWKQLKNPDLSGFLWEHTGSNRGPSACKADALNQLSYAPFIFGSANIRDERYFKKFKSKRPIATGQNILYIERAH